jgi:hypothetical protein
LSVNPETAGVYQGQLAALYAKRFIQRRNVKAVQLPKVGKQIGAYIPDRSLQHLGQHAPLGFGMNHLFAHLAGTATYGHYLTDENDMARCFALDIDLNKTGWYCPIPSDLTEFPHKFTETDYEAAMEPIQLGDPTDDNDDSLRLAWLDRAHPARNWLKYQMGMLARRITRVIQEQLPQVGTAAAYSGSKGIHVYGFTGPMSSEEVRAACLFVLDYMDEWQPIKGQHFFGHRVENPSLGFQNFTIETYPKQDTLEGKDLGNLLRLPLGRNLKSPDPTFFIDLRTAPGVMAPHPDPVALLESGDPYA